MDFTVTQSLHAPVASVLEVYADPGFFTSLEPNDGLSTPELLDHQRNGDTVELSLRFHYLGDIPAAARRFVDRDRLSWVEHTSLSLATARSTSTITPDNYPKLLASRAVAAFAASGSGTTRTVRGRVTVRVPVVAGRVEQVIVDGINDYLAEEAAFANRRLGQG